MTIQNLAEKCYQSVVEVLQKSGKTVPLWEEMPQEFRDKFEAELNEGLRELGLK
ncbi:hypothetical protein [Nostoc sp. 'Peltigera membranacea cyanobiont' 210A]|uniref:hypothetical protein n=1 Tax=Nostoc sp. 'Peltigera membranacea cyanobiont' 210A TaxID=2014529 RepID=UPI00167D8AEE|nr:hypothetical protein [Nostoc sp. 'Peltigera membranacea cyanobiont' 210A]